MFCELLLCIQKLCVLFGLLGFRDCVFCQMLLYIWKLCVFLNFVELPKCFFLVKCFRNVVVYLEIVFFFVQFCGVSEIVCFVKCRQFC